MTNLSTWISTNKLKSVLITLLLIPVIYILYMVGIFALIRYVDSHAYDTDYSKLPKPYSQRGEPLPTTDVPVILPPDPGEAGKKTLAGIDSNNDGVRDDLEREIVYMYPQNEEVRRVLRAMVKKGQEVITTEGDHEHFKKLILEYFNYESCYKYLIFGPIGPVNNTNKNILINMLNNTRERKKMDQEHYKVALPFSVTATPTSCNSVAGKY